jgi:hypothetical protein
MGALILARQQSKADLRPEARYLDLGAGFYESRISNQHREHDLIRQLERLAGQKVAPQPRPDQPAA